MQSLIINFQNPQIVDKFLWFLDHFKKDGVEVVSKEDIEDLKALSKTREEESIPFEDYLKDAH